MGPAYLRVAQATGDGRSPVLRAGLWVLQPLSADVWRGRQRDVARHRLGHTAQPALVL